MHRIKRALNTDSQQHVAHLIKQSEYKGTLIGRGVKGNNEYFWISNNQNITANAAVYLPNQPQQYTISSDSVNDTGNVKIEGLDGLFRNISEEITMDGSNSVNLDNEYTRINKIEYIGSNVSTFTRPVRNEGNISIINSSNLVISSIVADQGVSYNGCYTVPSNYKIYLNDVIHSSPHSKGNNHNCVYEIIKIKHDNTYIEDYKNETIYISDETHIHNFFNNTVDGKDSILCFARPDSNTSGVYSMSINYTINS